MYARTGNIITAEDVAANERDGVVCLRDEFDRDWFDCMCAATDTTAQCSPA
jgi:hypothetical protein